MTNEVTIHVKAKDDASKTFTKVESNAKRLDGNVKKMAGVIGVAAGAAGAALVKFGVDSVKKASDLNETINKTKVIFGTMTPVVTKFASTAAKDLGMSRQAAMEAAASMGDMFLQLGFAGKQATRMSLNVVRLSADLGSFNNLPTADVQERIAAAFRGEYDSLQALVPTINAAAVQQRAMADTGKKNADKLTAQEKAAATLAIIMDSTTRAQGDFQKTSKGLANTTKILAARIDDLQAKIGGALLPVVSDMAEQIGHMFDEWESSGQMQEDLDKLAQSARDAQSAFEGFHEANTTFADAMLDQKHMIQGWRVKMLEGILTVVEAWSLINPRMKSVAIYLRGVLAGAREDFEITANEINNKKIKPQIKADIKDLQSKIKEAKKRLRETHDQKTKAKIEAEIRQLKEQVAAAKRYLASINGDTATTYIRTVRTSVEGGSENVIRRATGGIVGAAGGGPRGGQVLVGEQGPEIVNLPFGSHVNSNADSRRIASGGGRGSVTININAPGVTDTNGLRRMLVDMHRRGELDVVLR